MSRPIDNINLTQQQQQQVAQQQQQNVQVTQQQAPATTLQVTAPQHQVQIPDEVALKIQSIFGNMLNIADDLSHELATTDCPSVYSRTCKIAELAREIVKQLKELVKIYRSLRT